MGHVTKSLLPQTVTIWCGGLGASKSFMLLEAAAYWYEQGVKIAIYELEESRDFHLLRVLAQKSGEANITDTDWVKKNPERVREIYTEHTAFLDGFGSCVHARGDKQLTLAELAQWFERQAKAGYRVICADPVTAAQHVTKEIWKEDNEFLNTISRISVNYNCSIVLITHPTKSVSFPDINQLAGGSAFVRFTQTVLWLESHDGKTSLVKTDMGTINCEHNRTVHLLKTRNSNGQGLKLAFNFQPESLTLREIGIILKDKNK